MFKIKITSDFVGISPVGFLKKRIDMSYFHLSKLIDSGKVTINNKRIEKNYKFKLNDEIVINSPNVKLREKFLDVKEQIYEDRRDMKIDIVYEDENFLVLNKPAKIVVQTGCENKDSINWHLNYLKFKNKEKDKSNFKYTNCHRIDKNTSGVLVCAKNQKTLRDMNEIFRERKIQKKYVCLVVGTPKKTSGEIEVFLERTPEGRFPKVIVTNKKSSEKTKRLTKSKYRIIKSFKKDGDNFSLIEVEILTGYTHQIRVHMKHIACPIFADKMYGNLLVNDKYSHILQRQFLHAKNIEFNYENKSYCFKAPLIYDLKKFLEFIKQ
jgi:RluA family pseudouridine synthase